MPLFNSNSIRSRRMEMGLSQRDLAEQLNVTQAAVNQFERGTRQPSLSVGLQIAAILGCEPEDLYKPYDARKEGNV